MDSDNIGKPSLKERFSIGVANLKSRSTNGLNNFKGRFTGWDMRKIARVVLYAGGVVFVVVLVISAGRTPQSQTATTVTQAPAAFTINKWYDYAGSPTAKSGSTIKVHLRLRNPGQPQDAKVVDNFPPGFQNGGLEGGGIFCPGLGPNSFTATLGAGNEAFNITKVPNTDNCEIVYNLIVP